MVSTNLRAAAVKVAAVAGLGLALGLGACTTPNYDRNSPRSISSSWA
jgi:hypothetical protein